MLDAHYAGGADTEQAVFGDQAELRLYQATDLNDVPAESSSAICSL